MAAPARSRPAGRGFTLLEVMIAVAILSLSLTSLLGSQMASMRATDQARQLSSVAFLAEWQLIEIEWELKQDGWGVDDQTFEGDFSDQGWPDVRYVCVVDLVEMPDYNQLVAAKDSETDGDDNLGVQDAGDTAFSALGMVWPIVKEAIEQSIRKSWCTVRWNFEGKKRGTKANEFFCADDDFDCLTVATFWTDPEKLKQLPALGGEAEDGDDVPEDDPGAGGAGSNGPGGGGGGGGGRGGGGGGGGSKPTVNSSIPSGPGRGVK